MDESIEAAERQVREATAILREASALRQQVETERRRARGRLLQGEVAAGPDLDQLRDQLIEARRAEQEAEPAVRQAEAEVQALRETRGDVERGELTGHLAAVLALRAALAQDCQARLTAFVATISAYRLAVDESVALARLLPAVPVPHPSMDAFLARATLQALRPVLPKEFPHGIGVLEPPLTQSEASATQAIRAALERER
jgi:hypothetical protein